MSSNKIFFVDDDEVTLFLYKRLAKKLGVEAVLCENGKVFLEEYRKNQESSLVILDINMPVLNGVEVIKELKSAGELNHVAVVAMLGDSGKEDVKAQIQGLGVQKFADKPLNEAVLRSLLEQDVA